MLVSAAIMTQHVPPSVDRYHGLFLLHHPVDGPSHLTPRPGAPTTVPDPQSGRPLQVATLEGNARAICPACASDGKGGFVSFVQDLRLAYACPSCEQLVWLSGA